MNKFKAFLIVALILGAFSDLALAQIRAGSALAWGSRAERFGWNINGEYLFENVWSAGADVTYFFTDGADALWTLNLDGHYHIFESDMGRMYLLSGMNFSTLGDTDAKTKLGLNIGFGYNMRASERLIPFADLKYVLSSFDQVVLRFGIRYNFNTAY